MDLKFDLHVHTNYSDGVASPLEVLEKAKVAGMTGIAIADHDNMDAYPEAKKIAKKLGIILIPSVEITTLMGDILALGVNKIPKSASRELSSLGNVFAVIDEIHGMGGIAALAHPFGGHWPVSFTDLIEKFKNRFDAIEVYNSFTDLKANMRAMKLAKGYGITGIAGSDAHFAEHVGTAYTISQAEDIIEAIKSGKVRVGWEP
jgi:predicted metal-dependent phosphoesterase TrpH